MEELLTVEYRYAVLTEGQLRHIRAAVSSLAGSTNITFATAQATANVTGRCSPYASHRTVAYVMPAPFPVHGQPLVAALNSRYGMAVYDEGRVPDEAEAPHPQDGLARETMFATIPAGFVQPLLDEAGRWLPIPKPRCAWVTVAVSSPILESFDEGGRPVWRKAGPEPEIEPFALADDDEG